MPTGVGQGEGCVTGGGQGGNRGSGQTSRASQATVGPRQSFGSKAGSHWKDLSREKMGSGLRF